VRRMAPLGVVAAEVGSLKQALESDLARSRGLVVTLGDGSQALRAVASPLKFDGYTPHYGLPPLLNEHHYEVLGKVNG
jgi:CoA:oxalate CoA-transferase